MSPSSLRDHAFPVAGRIPPAFCCCFPQVVVLSVPRVPRGAFCAWWWPPPALGPSHWLCTDPRPTASALGLAGRVPAHSRPASPALLRAGLLRAGPRTSTAAVTWELGRNCRCGDPRRLVLQGPWRRCRACLWFGCMVKREDHCLSVWPVARKGRRPASRQSGGFLSVCCGLRTTSRWSQPHQPSSHISPRCALGPLPLLSGRPDAHGASLRSSCTSGK